MLRGHLVIDTLSLTRPSLNLVRDSAGDWNLAEWLPRPVSEITVGAPYPLPRSPALRFRRIEIDGGRINFKRGDDKMPLRSSDSPAAPVPIHPAAWRIDLLTSDSVAKAAVPMQQSGSLARVRLCREHFFWACVQRSWISPGAMRPFPTFCAWLAPTTTGFAELLALRSARPREQDDGWTVRARVQLAQLHRWDLALRADNPSANVILTTEWHPTAVFARSQSCDSRKRRIRTRASPQKSHGIRPQPPRKEPASPIYAELSGSQIDMGDLLSWVRAFHKGIADDSSLQGIAAVRGVVSGWPVRVASAVATTSGVSLTSTGLRRPARLGEVQVHYDRGLVSLAPVEISFGPPENALRVESSGKSGRAMSQCTMRLSGSLSDVRDLLATTSALGWKLAHPDSGLYWRPMRGDLRWQGPEYPWREPAVGFIEWGATAGTGVGTASLRAPFLNLPVDQIRARLDLKPGARHITLTSAQAFGARWSGTLDRSDDSDEGGRGASNGNFRFPPIASPPRISTAGSIPAGGKAFSIACFRS